MRWKLARRLVLATGIAAVILAAAPAQEGDAPESGSALGVTRAVIARGIEEREPVEEGSSFSPDIGHLFFFTVIEGAEEETVIYHVWSYGGEEKARVDLPVRGGRWRTWSQKTIPPAWTGDWSASVENADGALLTRIPFTIGESSEQDQEAEGENPAP